MKKAKFKVIKGCRSKKCGSAAISWETMNTKINIQLKKAA